MWEGSALQFRREGGTPIAGRQKGVVDRGPAGGVGVAPDHGEPPSPSTTQFATSFPSLDDFERDIRSPATSSSFTLPSVPSFDPGTTPGRPPRPPPPHPPKPRHLDERTFARAQHERIESMARVAESHGSGSYTPPPPPPNRASLPTALVPGGGKVAGAGSPSFAPARRPSTSAQPLTLPTSASRSLKIPFVNDVKPGELWRYLQSTKAETGEGPRVLLLDLRSREEYEHGHVKAETVCLEPIILRDGCVPRLAVSLPLGDSY